jgi:putative addiction module component (TIGR02574 family)
VGVRAPDRGPGPGVCFLNANLRNLPLDARMRMVEDLWDSIAADQNALPLTPEQKAELDRRLDAYEADRDPGHPARKVIARIRKNLLDY